MHSIVTFFQSVPASTWQVIGAALGLSTLLQALKHWFFKELSAQALMALTTLFAFLGSAIPYFESTIKSNPTILGQHTAALLGVMTLAYRYVVSPGYNLLIDAKSYRTAPSASTTSSAPGSTASTTVTSNTPEANF